MRPENVARSMLLTGSTVRFSLRSFLNGLVKLVGLAI